MEENTVLLSLKEYNELRDLKIEVEESIKNSKFAVITKVFGNSVYSGTEITKYLTEKEAIVDFQNENNELNLKIIQLEKKVEKSELIEAVLVTIDDLKNMSYWEFRKWRKS